MRESATTSSFHEIEQRVPFHRPWIGQEEEREVLDSLRSGWLTTGPKTRAFERAFAEYTHAKHAVAVNSCTAALHLSLLASGIGTDDEVITTPTTFAATANVIEHVGARPVFVDVVPDTLNIDPDRIEDAISPHTKAIIPVHFAGHPCDLDAIHAIARKQELVVIEDAAHAIESWYRDQKIGSISPCSCFSFYATKNLTTGEGGMITTDDDDVAERLRILSLHGISVDASQRYGPKGYKHWDILEAGYKYNMFDLQACLGIHQLARVETFRERRREMVERYDQAFSELPEVVPLQRRPDVTCGYHLYVVRFAVERLGVSRDQLIEAIQNHNIGIGVHFRPVHLHPYYRNKYGFAEGLCPVAEAAGERVISLPLFPTLEIDEQQHVIRTVRNVVQALRRT